MRASMVAIVACILVAAGCAGSGASEPAVPSEPGTTESPEPTDVPVATEPVVSEPPSTDPVEAEPPDTLPPIEMPTELVTVDRLTVTGSEEIVFDWTTDRCEDEHIPDIAPRAYRSADGQAQMTIGHYVTYRMIGPDLNNLVSDCTQPQLRSDFDPDPAAFNDSEWIGGTYTTDGETVYAVVHNEYRGDTHGAARPGQCETGERLRCLDTSFTLAVSTDGGATFSDAAPAPDHLIATLPYPYDDDGVPSGIRQPSNIVEGPDGYLYLFGNISDQPNERQWVCAMRTRDIADPASWEYWDGNRFSGSWGDPYREDLAAEDKCAPLADEPLSGSLNESVIFDESIGRFVSVGVSFDPAGGAPNWAVYYSTSVDLERWSTRQLLLEVPINNTVDDPNNDTVHAYPALIDPDSTSMNFGTSDGEFYLYMSRFNFGGNSLDRDLLRWPVTFAPLEVESPAWTFDENGSTNGWRTTNGFERPEVADGVLSINVIGDDPSLEIGGLQIPAEFDQMTIRMRVQGPDDSGQLFFVTDVDGTQGESKSARIEVVGGDEFRDYEIDLSTKPSWEGVITGLRFDPVDGAAGVTDRTVEIDAIVFSRG